MTFIVCGWYTPDYEIWANVLIGDLDRLGLPHAFEAVPPLPGNWESKTMMKPICMRRALKAANGRTVLFVDVDCRFRGTAQQIEAICAIDTDIALRFSAAMSRRVRLKMHPWSGTMVLRPTRNTYRLLDEWEEAGDIMHKMATDEHALGVAMALTPGLTVTYLHPDACAGANHCDPIISHPRRTGARASKFQKLFSGVIPW